MNFIGIILEYLDSIHALHRWSKELMAYDFLSVHRPDFMMRDVDALNRGLYQKVVNAYNTVLYNLHKQDCKEYSSACSTSVLSSLINRGKYNLKNHTLTNLVCATATDISIMLVDYFPLESDKESSEAILISCPKSSTASMVNCNKSNMNSMVNYNTSNSDNTVLYNKSSIATVANCNKSCLDNIVLCDRFSMTSMVNCNKFSSASMVLRNKSSIATMVKGNTSSTSSTVLCDGSRITSMVSYNVIATDVRNICSSLAQIERCYVILLVYLHSFLVNHESAVKYASTSSWWCRLPWIRFGCIHGLEGRKSVQLSV